MRLGIDVGGTFTDLVAYDATRRRLVVDKMLNQTGGSGVDVVDALMAAAIEPAEVAEFTHGTTKVTNLLIERSGARVGLLCSRGFRDVLEIQLSFRERSFDIFYEKVAPLVPRHLRLEVRGRVLASGEEAEPQDDAEIQTAIEALLAESIDSLAVALHNSYANPMHERHIQNVAMAIAPELPVSLSSTVDPRIGEYQRVSTCVLNALAVPTMQAYADDLRANLPFAALYMQSAAGVMPAEEVRERPIHLAFSGPAAGVVAGREIARQLGFENAITMDMGGTSFDVCLIWGDELVYRDQLDIDWGVPARVESLDLHTIGAGGGSICWRDSGGTLAVGPRSAGAIPGPVCYGRGGEEPTVTDANLVLGILSPDGLLGGQLTLDKERATEAFKRLGAAFDVSAEEAARGAYAIVNANMAQAIRTITVEKGIDPRDCALIAFGGAGPQHAAAVAELLGMRNVVIPAETSVLSALGLLTADVRVTAVRTLLRPLAALGSGEVEEVFGQLEAEASNRMNVDPAADEPLSISRHVGLRYVGQSHEVPLRLLSEDAAVDDRFESEHARLYGTRLGDPIEIVNCWVTVTKERHLSDELWSALRERASKCAISKSARVVTIVGEGPIPVYGRSSVTRGVVGPCLIEEPHSVTFVPANAAVELKGPHLVVRLEESGQVETWAEGGEAARFGNVRELRVAGVEEASG